MDVKKRTWKNSLYLIIYLLLLSGCLEDRQSAQQGSLRESTFEGVTRVTNLGGYPPAVRVEWNSSNFSISGYRVYALIKDSTTNLNTWTAISDILSPDTTSFLHSATDQVVSGQIITYKVQAIDLVGVEDGNNRQMSTVVFDGIQDVFITGKTTATVTISTGVGAFNEVRVYAQPVRSGAGKKLVATAVGNVNNILVTGLKSGVNYRFTANAYIASFNREDGNNVYKIGQTYSDSFGSGKSTDSDYKYRGVRLVQAFGDAPNVNVANGQPRERMVRITINPFAGATAYTKYKIVRGSGLTRLDTTTTTACTAATNSSCEVCTVSGIGPQNCVDTQVAPAPKKYDYTVALVKKDLVTNEEMVEELPTTNANDFVFSAHIPSSYMVLVQRDSANYEMCYQMKSPSDPRKKNRCVYSGFGATPYASGPGKAPLSFDPGYYDFGYNFLIDRHMVACNWTRAPACGPNGCVGDVSVDANSDGVPEGPGVPSNSIGVDGNVFFAINFSSGPNCFIKSAGTWKQVTAENTDSTLMAKAATIDPGPENFRHRPTLYNMTPAGAAKLCNSQVSDYGPKRMLRRREQLVATPLPYFEGEPGALTDAGERWRVQLGVTGYKDATTIYDSGECATGFYATWPDAPATIGQLVAPTNQRSPLKTPLWGVTYNGVQEVYFIGSSATRRCVSRFGVQDPLVSGNYLLLSDQFSRPQVTANPPPIYQGETSDFDSGNRDFVGFQFNETNMGASLPNAAGGFTSYILGATDNGNSYRRFNYFSPALGTPLLGGPPGQTLFNFNDFVRSGEFNPGDAGYGLGSHFTVNGFINYNYTQTQWMAAIRGSRWGFAFAVFQLDPRIVKTWCGVEAE